MRVDPPDDVGYRSVAGEGTSRGGRPRIMVVAALGRPDIVGMFKPLARIADLTFVEYERNWGEGLDPRVYEGFGQLTTWERHRSAKALLARTNPDTIAMISIGSRNQLVLRAEALRRGIEVVHVEHGYRLPPHVRSAPGVHTVGREGPRAGVRTNRFFVQSAILAGPRIAAAGLEASIRPPERSS